MFKKYTIYLILIVLIISGFVFYSNRVFIKNYFLNSKSVDLPIETSKDEIVSSSADLGISDVDIENNNVEMFPPEAGRHESSLPDDNQTSPNPPTQIKSEINLKVPFTIQSPDQSWTEIYKEACEEASVLMVYAFLENRSLTVDFAMKQITDMVNWEADNLGGTIDITAVQTLQLAKGFYKLDGEVVKLNSIDDIKKIVSSGSPVILPALGRELQNPNFKAPGPLYHMLVVKGYTKDGLIITNDPGTRKGENYLYDPEILFNAIGDWNANKMAPDANQKFGIVLR